MKSILSTAILFVALGVTSVDAQVYPHAGGPRLPGVAVAEIPSRSGRLSDADRARIAIYNYSACLIAKKPDRVNGLIGRFMDDDATAAKEIARVVTDDCLDSGKMRFPWVAIRGAFYRVLYRNAFRQTTPPASLQPVNYLEDVGDREGSEVAQYIELRRFGDCVVVAEPAEVHNLLISAPTSSNEKRAFAVIAPRFGPCLVEGVKARLSKESVLGLLAEVAYRRSILPQPATVRAPATQGGNR